MGNLRFVREEESDPYPLQADSIMYHSKAYLQLKKARLGSPLTFYALRNESALARIHFFVLENHEEAKSAISLPESPFGSLAFSNDLERDDLAAFIQYYIKELADLGVQRIEIKDCIAAYRTNAQHVLHSLFEEAGFVVSDAAINHHIEVDEISLLHKMHKMERKRLRKGQRLGMEFIEAPLASLPFYYQFLQNCRQEKGWKLSLSYEAVENSLQHLPEHYRIFALYQEGQCLAASLSVLVKDDILYDFYHDSLAAFKSWSPVVFLIDGIYQYCQQHGFRLLDLGTSVNPGLQQFKQHMGGVASYKYTYEL